MTSTCFTHVLTYHYPVEFEHVFSSVNVIYCLHALCKNTDVEVGETGVLCVFVFVFLNKFACICSARLTWILRASREPIYLVGILPLELLGPLVRALSMNTNT